VRITSSVKLEKELHDQFKIYCVKNNLKMFEAVDKAIREMINKPVV